MVNRDVDGRASVSGRISIHTVAAAMAPTASAAPMNDRREVVGAVADAARGSFRACIASSISSRAAAAEFRRCLRSLARQRRNSVRIDAGVCGKTSESGSSRNTFARVSEIAFPPNARRAVSISSSTAPNAHKSVRSSTISPRACSGLM